MSEKVKCPTCGKSGHLVDGATVKSMLAVSLRHVQNIIYRFCTNADCDVVYYSDDAQTFTTHEVRERVYQKEPESDDVLICYCFRHTPGDIRQQFSQSNHKTIIDDINTGIQAGQCACDWRNPQGNCCLGNVRQLVKRLETTTITSDVNNDVIQKIWCRRNRYRCIMLLHTCTHHAVRCSGIELVGGLSGLCAFSSTHRLCWYHYLRCVA